MRAADITQAKDLTEKYRRAVAAWRALREHAGPVKVGFGQAVLGLEGTAHSLEISVHDRDYNVAVHMLRDIAARQVADIATELAELGVDVNA